MHITVTTNTGPVRVKCYGTFYVNFDGTDVLFCFTDSPNKDALELTEYQSGLAFPVNLGEPRLFSRELITPMTPDDPHFVTLVRFANRLIDDTLRDREMKRWRMLELIQINQRKYKANEIDF